VRETNGATDLVRDIAKAFDKRITAQRTLLRNLGSPNIEALRDSSNLAIKEYSEGYNEIRYRLNYYTSYQEVLDFERQLHDRLVSCSNQIYEIAKLSARRASKVQELDNELSLVSELVFKYCRNLSNDIANERIGSLPKIHDWKDPDNEFVGSWRLIKRLLNI
jgi:hypothetical protein